MRRLGKVLKCDPMSLYRYAANRAALLDGVYEVVLDELAVIPDPDPDPDDSDESDWQAQLCRIAHDLRLMALGHPNTVPLLVTRPLSTPLGTRPLGTLRPLEQILALLIEAPLAGERLPASEGSGSGPRRSDKAERCQRSHTHTHGGKLGGSH